MPVWCGTYFTELAEGFGEDAAEECAAAFSHGFEKAIIMAMLRPEWAQGFYLKLREYYLLTHTATDLAVWDEEAEETCRAIPLKAEVRPTEHSVPTEGMPAGGDGHGDGADAEIGSNAEA